MPRAALASPETGKIHPNLESWIVSAIDLGARLIGNAVPPKLLYGIALSLFAAARR